MFDPLAQVVLMLQPQIQAAKAISGAGRWSVRRANSGEYVYCAILEGKCRLAEENGEARMLVAGDFLLASAIDKFALTSEIPPDSGDIAPPTILPNGDIRHGNIQCEPDVRFVIGHCSFRSPDANLLASVMPSFIYVRGETRLVTLVKLLNDEIGDRRPGREVVVEHLLEILFIEALRSSGDLNAPPGLIKGLADKRLMYAIQEIHENPEKSWTLPQLANAASLSRSSFSDRFRNVVGMAPMEYVLRWRMALAKKLLRESTLSVAAIAEQVGYGSATAFTIAFKRHVGLPPARYSRHVKVEKCG